MNNNRIPLKGACNFRDIGGYQTDNGRTIKNGMIYRSGHLAHLSKSDLKQLEPLGIKLVIDLRSPAEREHHPTRLPANHRSKIIHQSFHDGVTDIKTLYRKVFNGTLGEFDFYQFILAEYKRYIIEHVNEITEIFKLLQNPDNYPLLIHCNGGKDRTGTMIALILFALGVDKKDVFHNYMLSHTYMEQYVKSSLFKIKLLSLFRANVTQLKPAMETHSEYLQTAIDTIETNHDSIQSYIDYLGVDSSSRALLADILCD
jgi:protein-tyrosine phosphatase